MLLRLLLLRALSPRLYRAVVRVWCIFLLVIICLAGWIAAHHAEAAFSPEAIRAHQQNPRRSP